MKKLTKIHYDKNILPVYSAAWKRALKDDETNKKFIEIANESVVNDLKIKIKLLKLMPTPDEYKKEALSYLESMLNEYTI